MQKKDEGEQNYIIQK